MCLSCSGFTPTRSQLVLYVLFVLLLGVVAVRFSGVCNAKKLEKLADEARDVSRGAGSLEDAMENAEDEIKDMVKQRVKDAVKDAAGQAGDSARQSALGAKVLDEEQALEKKAPASLKPVAL